MSDHILIFPPGTKLRMMCGDDGWQQAIVQAVRVQVGNVIDYNLIYWKDGERKTTWVESFEVKPTSPDDVARCDIGFIRGASDT